MMRAERPEEDDERLVLRVRAGESSAFRILVERYQAPVYRLVSNLAGWQSPAEELAQDVFVAAYAALGSFDASRGRFVTWLCAIARNRALNAAKKAVPIPVGEVPPRVATETPLDALIGREFGRRIDRALADLAEDQRAAFVLKEVVGLSTEEIAAIDSVDAGTVRSRLSRARERLRAALEEER